MKQILFISSTLITTISCVKMPNACFTTNPTGIVTIGTTVNFNASCSKNTDTYTWNIINSANEKLIHSFDADTAKIHSYKFADTGTFSIRLTTVNEGKKGVTTQKNITVIN